MKIIRIFEMAGNSLPKDVTMPPGNVDLQYRELLNVGTGVSSEL
jgi:hypothetical protein